MADIDSTKFEAVRRSMPRIREEAARLGGTEALPYPENVLDNTGLLLDTLSSFFQMGSARYLPGGITSTISSKLSEIQRDLEKLPTPSGEEVAALSPDIVTPILQRMDELYAYCLQYGLISFGLDPKVSQEKLYQIQTYVGSAETASSIAKVKIADAQKKLSDEIEKVVVFVSTRRNEYENTLKEKLASLEPQLAAIESHRSEVAAIAEKAKVDLENQQKCSAEATRIQKEMATLSSDTSDRAKRLLEEVTQSLTISQAAEKQTGEHSATAKAQAQAATDARAAIKEQLEGISAFYGEIEKHKKLMLDVQNEATANATSMKTHSDETIAALKSRTDKIVATNEALIDQIRGHLQNAIGTSLFTAFDKRRGRLFWGVIIWGIVLALGLGGAAGLAYEFAVTVATTKLDITVILARLLIAAPVAFWVIFAARQYSRERRAQEEYAFKATISISLEPYRELIEKMRKAGAAEDIAFLKDRIRDIFDNPTNRLYPIGADSKTDEHVN